MILTNFTLFCPLSFLFFWLLISFGWQFGGWIWLRVYIAIHIRSYQFSLLNAFFSPSLLFRCESFSEKSSFWYIAMNHFHQQEIPFWFLLPNQNFLMFLQTNKIKETPFPYIKTECFSTMRRGHSREKSCLFVLIHLIKKDIFFILLFQ